MVTRAPSPAHSRREREREDMRRQITSAARRLFVTEGYESTTIRRIADAIEYTPGAIYAYFEDKDAIFYALHQEGFLELQRRFAEALTGRGNPAEQLRRMGEAYLQFAREQPEMYHLMFLSQLVEANAWPEGQAAYETIRTLVQLAVSTGWIRPGDPDVIAFALWSAAHGCVALEICKRQAALPAERRREMAANAFDYLLQSMLTDKTPPDRPTGRPARAATPRRRRRAAR